MKITDVKTYVIETDWDDRPGGDRPRLPTRRQFIFVKVETDEGISGWGEVTNYPGFVGNRAVGRYIQELKQFLVGQDPRAIEYIWQRTFRLFTYTGTRGATTAAISGIDIALWDILGKSLGKPIYALLGGPVRDRIALYTHPPEPNTPEEAVADAKEIVASGHRGLKMDPMMHSLHGGLKDGNISFMDGELSPQGLAEAVDITAAVREAVGPQIEVLIDAHGRYNVPTAIQLANALEPFNIHWFEEPVPVESYSALKQVREKISCRISVGERLHTRFEFVPIFENNLADYIMPDVTWTGGISELKKISTMAEAYYIPVSPHDASGPINIMAGAQVMMTVPNFYKLETIRYDLSGYDKFMDVPLDIRSGDLYVSDRPGLGMNLDEDFLKAHTVEGFRD
ncbi:MAG: mandelate racemase [SAR202 cluster bacterium Casp-Chloro-G4]|nr:mandelate racemase/muconate lactonizing enzyme family protein [Chloroflexota bacterium]MDA1226897.1 mandelate racemase/muconate lactonizing enzyme family protein [Chloroflexota bacterium]PKB62067.1 MAG: mandelate racemase [SAR202 cluster bacterium Casp-Chloro-G4]